MGACEIDRHEVQRLATDHAPIVDVLPRRAFSALHIAGALNVPLGELDRPVAAGLARRGRPVVLYCNDYTAPTTVRPGLLLDAAAERFGHGVDNLLVTTSDGILLGLLTRADVDRQLGTAAAARSG